MVCLEAFFVTTGI